MDIDDMPALATRINAHFAKPASQQTFVGVTDLAVKGGPEMVIVPAECNNASGNHIKTLHYTEADYGKKVVLTADGVYEIHAKEAQ